MQRLGGRTQEGTFLWQNVCNHLSTSRIGSWRICEKDSVSLVSRHPGGRHRNDLLGQCAQRAVHPVVLDAVVFDGPATAADAAAAVSGDAALFAADSDCADPVQHAGPILAGSVIAIAFEQHASEQHAGPVRAAAGFASSVADAFGTAAGFFDSGHDRS